MIFLVVITSARRVSELGAFSAKAELCICHRDKVILCLDPTFIPKINTCFHKSQAGALLSFCPKPVHPKEKVWNTLDVQRILKIFLHRTQEFRNSDALFINISPPHEGEKMSKSAISSAMKSCIKEAYRAQKLLIPEGITAHSTRRAAANVALNRNASVEEICRAATRSSLSTFIRHYKINTYSSADAAFGRRALLNVLEDNDESPPGTLGHCS